MPEINSALQIKLGTVEKGYSSMLMRTIKMGLISLSYAKKNSIFISGKAIQLKLSFCSKWVILGF